MDKLKLQLERRLIANLLIDKCKLHENVIIDEAWCTQDRVIRFTTKYLRALCPTVLGYGFDKTGEIALYEVKNEPGKIEISCQLYSASLPKAYKPFITGEQLSLFSKSCDYKKPDDAVSWFASILNDFIPVEEKKHINEAVEKSQAEVLIEGSARSFVATRYERNRKAREICLAYHGKSCKVCGMNFEQFYGKEFADIIEVHHIVPVSEIAESYIVDPINDLIPLCPNCHTAIHSSTDGAYPIDCFLKLVNKNSTESKSSILECIPRRNMR